MKYKKCFNIPNFLTLVRLIFIIPIVYSIASNYYYIAILFFILSNITDKLDGYIARKTKTETVLGGYFDFISDLATINAIIISLFIVGQTGKLNLFLTIAATTALIAITIIISLKAKQFCMPHRFSIKILFVIITVGFYCHFLQLPYADIFLTLAVTPILGYTITDYIIYIIQT